MKIPRYNLFMRNSKLEDALTVVVCVVVVVLLAGCWLAMFDASTAIQNLY